MKNNPEQENDEVMSVAIYARTNEIMQDDMSIEDQIQYCKEKITRQGGVVTNIYEDGAKSGWSLDREAFQEMRSEKRPR